MAPSRSKTRLAALILLSATTASARTRRERSSQAPLPSNSISGSSSATTSASPTETLNIPLSLYSLATSLITHYYPGQTITNPATLTWPGTVVIDGSTYTLHSKPTGTTSSSGRSSPHHTAATATPSSQSTAQEATSQQNNADDKRVGIILGVVLGAIALILMAFLFWCLARRRRDTGSFFMRRRTPSTLSSGSRRPPRGAVAFRSPSSSTRGRLSQWDEKQAQMSIIPKRKPPPAMHPALIGYHSSRSTSDDNPFYTPDEGGPGRALGATQAQELDYHEPAQRRSSSSIRDARPPTPFSPMEMASMPAVATLNRYQTRQNQPSNPFSSPYDQEADDLVSPILPPSKNPERRYSPIIHYPSWSEVSEFDFAGDGRRRLSEDGGDGWRPWAERGVDGRHELA